MTIKEIWDYIQAGGVPALMAGIGYALHRGFLVLGREVAHLNAELERQRKETQRWQDEALHLLKLADRSVTTVEAQTKRRRNVEDVS